MSFISSSDFLARLMEREIVPEGCFRVLLVISASERPYSVELSFQTRPGMLLWESGPLLKISGRELMWQLGDIIPDNACLVVFDAAQNEPLKMEITTLIGSDEELVGKLIEGITKNG